MKGFHTKTNEEIPVERRNNTQADMKDDYIKSIVIIEEVKNDNSDNGKLDHRQINWKI